MRPSWANATFRQRECKRAASAHAPTAHANPSRNALLRRICAIKRLELLERVNLHNVVGVSYLTGHLAYSITPGWESFDATFKAAQKVADYPHLAGDEAEAVPAMSDNDLSMIYEFLFADTSTYDLDTFTALDARVHGYGLFTLKTAVLSRKSFTAFVAGLVVIVAAIAAHLAYVLRLRGGAHALMWSAPVMLALEYLIVFLRARPKMHVILPAFVVAIFVLVVPCLAPHDDAQGAERPGTSVVRRLAMPAVLALCLLAVTAFVELKYARPNQASMRVEASTAAQAYVDEKPEKIVMFAHTQGLLTNADCLSFDRWQLPSNALFVGGYEQYTAPWQTFLTSNNLKLDGLFMNLLDSSRMVAVANADQAQMFATYLTEHSGSRVEAHMDESLGMGSGSIEYGVWSFSAA